jgi:predicted DNA-binding antitoxin AbrB/MazE fold protein
MERTISVVYENGVLKPLEPLPLEEGEKLEITFKDAHATPKGRKLDLMPGAFKVPDDFDDPLPDEFWLGEE